MTGKEDWYRTKRARDEDYEGVEAARPSKRKREEERKKEVRTVTVMFVPYTRRGELARRLREAEEDLGDQTGVKVKIVERTGRRLVDLLHKADPWQGQDCGRPKCLLCMTKLRTGKDLNQECTKRCIVYQTWCISCEEKSKEKIENDETLDEKEKKVKLSKIKLFTYIGESSRSIYERGLEHITALEEMKPDSHMLKHYFDEHGEEEVEEMIFGVRILKQASSAFNRQIAESVEIQNNLGHNILNSKSEYNRCALPRLTAKLNQKSLDKLEKEQKEEKEQEKILMRKIRDLKVQRSEKRRDKPGRKEQPAEKRRKISGEGHIRVINEKKDTEKRKTEKIDQIFKRRKREAESKELEINVEDEKVKDLNPDDDSEKNNLIETVDWEKKLEEREAIIVENEIEKKEREKVRAEEGMSFKLLKLCKELLEEEGAAWEKSKERRMEERRIEQDRKERLEKGEKKRHELLERLEKRKLQTKISDALKTLPKNRKILLERQEEKEKQMLLEESKLVLWKKWRQKKGRYAKETRIDDKEKLEVKLKKIEKEVLEYEKELAEMKKKQEEKRDRLARKKSKEKRFEMMKWVVKFIEENKPKWEDRRKQEILQRKKNEEFDEWKTLE